MPTDPAEAARTDQPTAKEPAAPRRAATHWIAVVASLLVAALVAFGVAYALKSVITKVTAGTPSATMTTTPPSTVAAAPPASPSQASYTGDLASLVLPMPDDAQTWTPNAINDAMSDLDRSATLWNENQPQQIATLLKGNGYERGLTRAWQDSTGTVVLIDLMQFATTKGMYDWLVWSGRGLNTNDTEATGNIREVDSGRWAEFAVGINRQLVLVFGKGQFGVVMRVHTDNTADLDRLTALSIEQYRRLP
jgi:hypothetical protein